MKQTFKALHCWSFRNARNGGFSSQRDSNMENHYSDIIMSAVVSQITGVSVVYSTVCSGADQRKHQSSSSLAFVRGIHWWPVNSPHKGPATRKNFYFMTSSCVSTPRHSYAVAIHDHPRQIPTSVQLHICVQTRGDTGQVANLIKYI